MSQIITPESNQATKPQGDGTEAAAELTHNEVNRIAGALADLHALEDQKIVTATSEAQKRGLREYLANSFIKHGPHFLGAYYTLKGEYEPLIGTLAILFKRVDGNINYMRVQEAMHRKAQVEAAAAAGTLPTPSPEAAALKESQKN